MTNVTVLHETKQDHGITQEVLLNLGPQHPSTHGVLRLILQLDGEIVKRTEPFIGYLHRGTEKLCEHFTYTQIFPLTDRLDYVCPPSNNLGFALAVERLLGIEAPERAQYIRVMMTELSRISGHLLIVGALPMDLGAMTVLLYAMREREMVMDLMEMITGARMHTSYCRVGGVREDLPEGAVERVREFCDILPKRLFDYERLVANNRMFLQRTRDIGVIAPKDAIDMGLSGPNLRASGVDWDIRRDCPYEIYDRMDFNVITRENGDCFDRWICRIDEMRESVRIIEQCLDQMPDGLFHGNPHPPFRVVGVRLQGAQGGSLRRHRSAERRARILRHQRWQRETLPRENTRPVLREPAGPGRKNRQHEVSCRPHRRARQSRPGDCRSGQVRAHLKEIEWTET